MELKPCPFCGNPFVRLATASEIEELAEEEIDEIDEINETFTVNCDYNDGGCGACGGYRITKKEAVELWNTRKVGE